MSDLTYKEDYDAGMIEFFVDGVLLTTWGYEDDAESWFLEFKKIFDAGLSAGIGGDISAIASAIHYPDCWDTAAYPTLLDAALEIGCNPECCAKTK